MNFNLKFTAMSTLMTELQEAQIWAIFQISSSKDIPDSVNKHDLIKIIIVLCEQLCWIEDEISGRDNLSENKLLSVADTEPAIFVRQGLAFYEDSC